MAKIGRKLLPIFRRLKLFAKNQPDQREGFYAVNTSVNPGEMTQFTLNLADELRPQEGSGSVLVLPEASTVRAIYLPLARELNSIPYNFRPADSE